METPQKVKTGTTIRPRNSTSGIYLNDVKSLYQRAIYTPMFIVALFTITRTRKQRKGPSADKWIKKMQCIHTMECYSEERKKERKKGRKKERTEGRKKSCHFQQMDGT